MRRNTPSRSGNNKMTLAEAGIAALNQTAGDNRRQHSPPLLKNGQKTALSWKNGLPLKLLHRWFQRLNIAKH